jgi:uncharacterized protein (DUF1330 family)
MSLTLCVLLWPRQGHEAGLIEYEDKVLRLVPEHGGRVLQRARAAGSPDEPLEVQLLEFPSDAALDEFMNDARRTSLTDERDRSIARTQVLRVELL